MLRLEHVTKSFAGARAVSDVSLELTPGRVLALVGPNGAGKSTTLRMACGLVTPDRGSVSFDGVPIGSMGGRLYRHLSAVLEDSSLAYMSLRGWANLEYQGALYGLTRRRTRERSAAMLDRLDLRRHMDKRVGDWSRGTQQKLALVTALLPGPQVLLLDESTLGLDVVAKRDFLAEVRRLADRGMAVLMTSHQSEVIEGFADDIALLEHGTVRWAGDYATFMDRFAGGDATPGALERALLRLFDDGADAARRRERGESPEREEATAWNRGD